MNNISFNEELHEYTVGGVKTPSVSQILKAMGLMDNFKHSEVALNNGTAIHKTLELYDNGTLDMRDLDGRLKKCIALWEQFKKDFGILKILAVEKKVSMSALYAGTVDRVVALGGGKKMVLDFKSGNPQRWGALQTAGYAMAYDILSFTKYERCCAKVHWDMDRIVYMPYHNEEDYNIFMSMANIYHWKKKNGYLREDKENGDNRGGLTE